MVAHSEFSYCISLPLSQTPAPDSVVERKVSYEGVLWIVVIRELEGLFSGTKGSWPWCQDGSGTSIATSLCNLISGRRHEGYANSKDLRVQVLGRLNVRLWHERLYRSPTLHHTEVLKDSPCWQYVEGKNSIDTDAD